MKVIIFSGLLASLTIGAQYGEGAKANCIPPSPKVPPPLPPTISIDSPQSRTYHAKDITRSSHIHVSIRDYLEFRVWNKTTSTTTNRKLQAPQDRAWISFITYTLDGAEILLRNITVPSLGSAVYDFSTTLTDLSDGKYTLKSNVTGRQSAANLVKRGVSPDKEPILLCEAPEYSEEVWSSSEVTFSIDTKAPTISIHTLKNSAYFTNTVPLVFTTDELVDLTGYRFDKGDVVICNERVQVTGLSEGAHKLLVYSNDTASTLEASEKVYFSVHATPLEPMFSMPKEYINYTIITRNGALWAIVEGKYPIFCDNAETIGNIFMVYPTPPDTTNLSVTLNGTPLIWENYTEQYSEARHHTALGDWAIIATTFKPSEFFVLGIHYEHPIMTVNESYQFLYDLNVSPYLSVANPTSTAYFTLKTKIDLVGLRVFTVPSDNKNIKEVEFTIENAEDSQIINFAITSEYGKPLGGDVLVTFSKSKTQADFSPDPVALSIVAAIMLIAVSGLGLTFWHRKQETVDGKGKV